MQSNYACLVNLVTCINLLNVQILWFQCKSILFLEWFWVMFLAKGVVYTTSRQPYLVISKMIPALILTDLQSLHASAAISALQANRVKQ